VGGVRRENKNENEAIEWVFIVDLLYALRIGRSRRIEKVQVEFRYCAYPRRRRANRMISHTHASTAICPRLRQRYRCQTRHSQSRSVQYCQGQKYATPQGRYPTDATPSFPVACGSPAPLIFALCLGRHFNYFSAPLSTR
jgi:hypothetical protein